jgi:peptide chain release factor 2
MQPYKLVKDVRTGYESSNVQSVMDGDIDGFIKAYLMEFSESLTEQ